MVALAPQRILVPVNGSPTDGDAVRLACRLARREKAKVYVITVIELRRGLALGTVQESDVNAAEQLLEKAEADAKALDVTVETELLQAREAGPAIVDESMDWRADLIVVGLPYRERFGDFYMGKTAPYLLSQARCQVLLFRDPLT